ncbi:hypothetical protein PIB30_083872 [Stylosanthes scabra]|uniref:Uncharacterized protein n=1 Tax=Stylosanthes scabra TaxID=79078 RepID=A0ABU6SSQ5_9FABA|nr:hypothetical protein [Stylosanthes scabra]
MAAKGKGKLATPPTQKSPRLAGLPSSLPPTFPKSVLRLNKILVLAIAAEAVRVHSKARESPQAPVVEPPKDVKGKRTARISVKPLRERFSQRIIARGGPSRPMPTKNEVIDLVSDEEKEAAEEKKNPEPEDEDEEEEGDPEEASASLTLPSLPKGPSGAYDDPHYWDYDGDLDQWGTDVFGGESAVAQASDSAEGSEGSCSPSSTSVE